MNYQRKPVTYPQRACELTRWAGIALLTLAPLWTPSPALAITINVNFDSDRSDAPAFDPAGTQLSSIMNAAANYWEDLIEDSWTLDIDFFWDNLSDTTIGLHENRGNSGGREDEARISFDTIAPDGTTRLWFFDPTPTVHGEYDMTQAILQDYTFEQMRDMYDSDPPDLLEVNFHGAANAGAPAAAINGLDLLSVALHEMGHALGMTERVAEDEVSDYEYDFNPSFINGEIAGAETWNTIDV
ncbi:MAG: hypothetical protein KDA60_19420, partial [Planctomycetales bacterium]|nr:hypothetical protein [Planctomycetales bacterium]